MKPFVLTKYTFNWKLTAVEPLCSVKIRVTFIHCKVSERISQYCHQVFMMSKNFFYFCKQSQKCQKMKAAQKNQNNKSNQTKLFLQKSSHSSQTSGHAQFDHAEAFHTLARKINNWGSRLTLQSISATTASQNVKKAESLFLLFGNWSLYYSPYLFISQTKA